MKPATRRALWIGGLTAGAAAAVGGIAYAASRPSSSGGGGKTASQLIPGHTYRFAALRVPGATADQISGALQVTFWKSPKVWFYGDPAAPTDFNWPSETRNANGYAAQAVWGGAQLDVPSGLFGLVDVTESRQEKLVTPQGGSSDSVVAL
jgi:hypothetical protein